LSGQIKRKIYFHIRTNNILDAEKKAEVAPLHGALRNTETEGFRNIPRWMPDKYR